MFQENPLTILQIFVSSERDLIQSSIHFVPLRESRLMPLYQQAILPSLQCIAKGHNRGEQDKCVYIVIQIWHLMFHILQKI
ncbi:hypothetical protein WA1_48555 [Scytonema hofmannii PCC 7110]|uniref:Uncharacterized protein n=1 Tax=Scytonema hofmannii PCC 7110 TaxID=128403 RepID=A0A139WTW7_9CYAN|nr:hypothetical protein WA1_48555 [Scytonema hofmannii PCC 7110]